MNHVLVKATAEEMAAIAAGEIEGDIYSDGEVYADAEQLRQYRATHPSILAA
jgi:hypothetical protein